MRYATLITGLVQKRVLRDRATAHIRYFSLPPMFASDGEMLVPTEEMNVTESIVPIIRLCKIGRPDVYIAYSEEIEELLGIPIRTILREKEYAYAELNRLRSLTAWQHIQTAWRKLFASS